MGLEDAAPSITRAAATPRPRCAGDRAAASLGRNRLGVDRLFHLPAQILIACAGVFALMALAFGLSCRRCLRHRRRVAATTRGLLAAVALLLAAAAGLLGGGLLGYERLFGDRPVAEIAVSQQGTQRYAVALQRASGETSRFELLGDEWQLDARVIRWTLPGRFTGLPPLYRLDRIAGRYGDIKQEIAAERSVYALSGDGAIDLWTLKRQHPGWLPFVDADYGSAAYLPLLDGARYEVLLASGGGLVARPADQRTRDLLEQAGW